MEITRHPADHILTLALRGRLDGTWSEHTTLALTATLEEGWHHLRLDLVGVTFLSSAGIRTLMLHYKKLAELKGSLAVINPSQPVLHVLETAGILTLLSTSAPSGGTQRPAQTFRGGSFESYPLAADGRFQAHLLPSGQPLCFTPDEYTLGLGLGTLGEEPGAMGEFLALAGAAIAQPADGQQSVDYLLSQGALQPRITPCSGIAARGRFALCLRFESGDPEHGLTLSALLNLALREAGSEAIALAFAAETEFLVGGALMQSPKLQKKSGKSFQNGPQFALPAFPEIRDQMLFTTEPAWPRSLTLGVAFAARNTDHPLSPQLRPTGHLFAHTHAATFPYRPLSKGELLPEAFIASLLENERPLGLLHLLNDHRPGGLGESRFHRGALWVAPIAPVDPAFHSA